ncbi:MAG: hypothetical protein IT285_09385, partial [Bdellovibrionales bacterium]|nr:hypothetical protein [Bdellovibrionales bacterium]
MRHLDQLSRLVRHASGAPALALTLILSGSLAACGGDLPDGTDALPESDVPPEGGGGGGPTLPTVQFSTLTSNADESVASVDLTVTLTPASPVVATVNYAVAGGTATNGGTDYTLASGMLTFTAGETSKTVTITHVDDSLSETNETLSVQLSSPSGAELGAVMAHLHTITDNDSLPTVEVDIASSTADEATTPALLEVVLSTA